VPAHTSNGCAGRRRGDPCRFPSVPLCVPHL